jgi:acetyltransferase
VILFGLGGQLVEVFKDRALGLPPLNDVLARRMMEQTKIFAALQGVRGRQRVDMAELERIVVRFSQLVLDLPWIKEIEINPLLVSAKGLIGLDARAVLHDPATPPQRLPKPAIRPYPMQYASACKLRDGTSLTLRPIRPEDEPLMVRFHGGLSEETVRFRYFGLLSVGQRTSHERLVRVCLSDYDRQIVLVADRFDYFENRHEIIGVGRLTKIHGTNDAEFAVVVGDQWQRRGLGMLLMQSILRAARDEKIARIVGDILPENTPMRQVCQKLGFELRAVPEEQVIRAEIQPR